MLQRYLMRPQKKTTIASVMKRPITALRNRLTFARVSKRSAAAARAGKATVPRESADKAVIFKRISKAIMLMSKYHNGTEPCEKHNGSSGILWITLKSTRECARRRRVESRLKADARDLCRHKHLPT